MDGTGCLAVADAEVQDTPDAMTTSEPEVARAAPKPCYEKIDEWKRSTGCRSTSSTPPPEPKADDKEPEAGTALDMQAKPTRPGRPPLARAHQGYVAKHGLIPAAMAQTMGDEWRIDVQGYRELLDELMAGSGNPKDPIERVLIEQIAMNHFFAAKLHVKSTGASHIPAVQLYTSAASRLAGEVRKGSLALTGYRHGQARLPARKQVTEADAATSATIEEAGAERAPVAATENPERPTCK